MLILSAIAGQYQVKAQIDSTGNFNYNFDEPVEYFINDIKIVGASYVQPALVVLFTELSIGQPIKIPGDALPNAISNLWKEQYFSDIQVELKAVPDKPNKVNVIFYVKERPRLSGFYISGLSNSQRKNLRDEISLHGNMIITSNLLNKVKREIFKYYREKGYWNVKVNYLQWKDTLKSNHNKLRIYVDKGPKVKVYDYVFAGNEQVKDKTLRTVFKKTPRKRKKINLFKNSKFIQSTYEDQKIELITRYNSLGFRDASLIKDTVTQISTKLVTAKLWVNEGRKYYFRNIEWRGNLRYSSGLLDTLLGIKKGDVYNQTMLDEKLLANPGGFDVSTLYMDNGYLFFNVTPVETGVYNDSIDIQVRIYEGEQATVNNVTVVGNTKTSDHVLLREIRTKPGDKFSKSDIQRSLRDLVGLNYFDPEQMNVNPVPNPVNGTVDIEYKVSEKPSDQIELSGGYGGGGMGNMGGGVGYRPSFVGTLGLTLNNFSSRKMLKPKEWSPLPSGDGQRLSLRMQSTGQNYQGYNFSFTEPWMGGKKPNSFSISLFHSAIAYNNRLKKDPTREVLFNTGGSISLGKRLKWPDDFFSINYVMSFQRYKFQNSGKYFLIPNYPANGAVYNPSFQVILSRNSVFNPIFPEGGSNFSFSVQATPPTSLLSGLDYDKLAIEKKIKWAEYHKWRFDASWYTPLNRKKTFVLATIAKFGYLGYYNPKIGSSYFERFRMGGTGLVYGGLIGAEIVPQRGYDEYNPADMPPFGTSRTEYGTLFNKYTMEIRYAISKNPQATAYLIGFMEGGNSWVVKKNYNPFVLRRTAGAGVRLFLPMFGLIGLDWGYAFDRKLTADQKKYQLQFLIGQQF